MTSPNKVKAKAQKLEEENYEFRAFLKNHADEDELDAYFLSLHKELFANYDCCKCANCCKEYPISFDATDIARISAFLGIGEKDFIAKYLKNADSADEKPHKTKVKPCPFLCDDGSCEVQGCKPVTCREYPYTDQPKRIWSLYNVIFNAEVCPVVFEVLERLKVIYKFRKASTLKRVK